MVATANPVRTARWRALRALALPGLVLLLARTAEVHADAARWFGVRGPHCPLGSWLGECACPGCGLVRGTALAAQGAFLKAWQVNPGGFVVVAVCSGAVLLHLDVLRSGARRPGHTRLQRLGRIALATGILLAWALRLCHQALATGSPA